MEIRIPEEDFENLRYLLGKRELTGDDIDVLKSILQKAGIVLNIKEFIAIRYDDCIKILSPGMSVTLSVVVYEGSILLGLNVENSLNFNMLSIELFPKRRDEIREFLNRMRSGGYPFDEHV
jgi:hypothetical protein